MITIILRHLWNRVKNCNLCCCHSEFFCSSSPNLEKCHEGCCGKCVKQNSETESPDKNDVESSFDEMQSSFSVTTESGSDDKRESDHDSESDNLNDVSF